MARKAEEQIVMALAAGASKESAAKIAGVSSRTVFRRCQDAEFRARVDRARAELVEGAVGRLSAIGPLAADELHRLIKDGTSDAVKLGAARSALDTMFRANEQLNVVRRLEELEQQAKAKGKR